MRNAVFWVSTLLVCSAAHAQSEPTFAPVCAAREIAAVTMIEDHGTAGKVSSDRLAQAGSDLFRARSACYAGRVSEAVVIYDSIITLGPAFAEIRR
jgi:hypothetical protein